MKLRIKTEKYAVISKNRITQNRFYGKRSSQRPSAGFIAKKDIFV